MPKTPKVPNLGLRRIREVERHESRSEFAYAMERTAVRLGESVTPSERYVAHLEDGDIRYPQPAYRRVLIELCGRPISELGFIPPFVARYGPDAGVKDAAANAREPAPLEVQQESRLPARDRALMSPWTVDGTLIAAREVSEVPVDRRSFLFLTGAVLTSPAHEWLIARPAGDVSSSVGRTSIEPGFVDHLDDMTDQLRRMDDQMGGGSLINVVRAQAGYVASLIRECRYTDSTGRRLHGSLGELLRLGGWVSYDDGDQAQAQRFWIAALHSAHTAGDSALGANVLGFMSEPAWEMGRLGDAAKLAETALAGYKGGSPRVSAILHMRTALAHAVPGDASECRRAIDAARDALRNSAPESGEPAWCYWMDEGTISEQIGNCLMGLNDYPSACDHLESSLKLQQGSQVREGAVRLTRLGSAYIGQDEPERACEVGTRAIETLSSQVDSTRIVSLIRRLRDDLEPYRRVPAVREFSDRVNVLSQSQRA